MLRRPSYLAAMSWIMEPKGQDSRKQIVIFKKVTTCFNFKDMFRCCQWTGEFHKLVSLRDKLLEHSSTILNTLDHYILQKSIAHNVSKTSAQFIKAHDKKLKKLTKNVVLPFTFLNQGYGMTSLTVTS